MNSDIKQNLISTLISLMKPRTIFTGSLYFIVIYLSFNDKPIPDLVNNAFIASLAYWFGEKSNKIKKEV